MTFDFNILQNTLTKKLINTKTPNIRFLFLKYLNDEHTEMNSGTQNDFLIITGHYLVYELLLILFTISAMYILECICY
jgi:hypothetical protein